MNIFTKYKKKNFETIVMRKQSDLKHLLQKKQIKGAKIKFKINFGNEKN